MHNGRELKIPHPPDWARERIDAIFGLVSRGTAPVYVERSSVLAIGQRCVTNQGFSAGRARPHSNAHLDGVVRPKPGDLLLNSTGTGTIGRSCVFDHEGEFIVDGHVTLLQPNSNRVESRWFDAILRSSWGQSFLETRCYSGSTNQVELSKSLLCSATVPVPSLAEQRRIAEILSLIDEALRRTEQLVEKLKLAKQGLLHDLLTRGIDDNGELRDPIRHPEHFKNSPLGLVPKGWEVENLGAVFSDRSKNGLYKPPRFHGRGAIMVQMGNIFKGLAVNFDSVGRVEVNLSEQSAYGLRIGDLLFGRRSLVLEGAGKCAIVQELPEDAIFESSIVRVRLDERRVIPLFGALFLSSELAYRDRRRYIRQVAVSGVSSGDIAEFLLPVPSVSEQSCICASIDSMNLKLESEARHLSKGRLLRQALMDDLLTGRVRVTPLLEKDSTP